MKDTITITISKARFHAYHGLYADEKKTGNEFEVDLAVSIDVGQPITDLSETVNYASLYEVLKREMQTPRELLETFAMELARIIHATFTDVRKVEISLTKLQAPIAKFSGTVGVKYCKEY